MSLGRQLREKYDECKVERYRKVYEFKNKIKNRIRAWFDDVMTPILLENADKGCYEISCKDKRCDPLDKVFECSTDDENPFDDSSDEGVFYTKALNDVVTESGVKLIEQKHRNNYRFEWL